MIVLSPHARSAMEEHSITEDAIRTALEHGECCIKMQVGKELRYGNKLELKDKTIVVIYTHQEEATRIITCYPLRRRKW